MSEAPRCQLTGTWPERRRLTLAETSRGDIPQPFTSYEWELLHTATTRYPRGVTSHFNDEDEEDEAVG